MVLALLILLMAASVQNDETPLITKYSKEVHKSIKKACGLSEYELVTDDNYVDLSLIMDGDVHQGYIYVAEVAACHLGGCVPSINDASELFDKEVSLGSEYFDVLVILTPEKWIKKIKILNYFSDYGYEVTSKNYLKKFQEKSVCAFSTGDDGIDAISGATISSMALEGALAQLCD